MPDQHREFFAQLPFVVLGTVDASRRPWASILCGAPGFLTSPDSRVLRVAALPTEGDPIGEGLTHGGRVGMLGIELPTRRRNRLNGRIMRLDNGGFTVAVEQSFGNCPQYIQRRDYRDLGRPQQVRVERFSQLDGRAIDLIRNADTCFVASATPPGRSGAGSGVDVSHRGGRPGFLAIAEGGAIEIPDYRGNRFYNTLGNLAVNPRAGLLFIDFAEGDLLQVTGATAIVWDGPRVQAFSKAERLWRLIPTGGTWLRCAFPLTLRPPELSSLLAPG
jgi:uncharacterized protein